MTPISPSPEQIAALVDAAKSSLGTVDILINNAVVRHFAPIESFRPEDWDKALAVNLSAAFHTARLVLPGMRVRNFGRIINISSIYGEVGAVNRVDYVTTKTALIGFTRAVALETAGQDITCNAICPGTVPTPAIEERLAAFMAKEGLAREAGRRLSWLRVNPPDASWRRRASLHCRLALRPGRPRHYRHGHSDRRRLERELAPSGPRGEFLVAIPCPAP